MAQENKFDYQVTQDGNKWNAEITRRVSARRTTVSKQKKGFESEELAELWAKEKLLGFLENLQEGNKRKAEKRVIRNELAAKVEAEKEAADALYAEKRLASTSEDDDIEE